MLGIRCRIVAGCSNMIFSSHRYEVFQTFANAFNNQNGHLDNLSGELLSLFKILVIYIYTNSAVQVAEWSAHALIAYSGESVWIVFHDASPTVVHSAVMDT